MSPQPDELAQLAAEAPPTGRTQALGGAFLVAWSALLLVAVASLMSTHWYAMPRPARSDAALIAALASLRAEVTAERWLAVHVLYSECRCSQRVVDHLLARGPMGGEVEELLLLVGADGVMARRARAAGWAVQVISRHELNERFHIEAAPLLLVTDAEGALRHVGGYTSRKQGLDFHDTQIVASLVAGTSPTELPLFGCATSAELLARTDPLHLRTRSEE